jgi:hypothetical protein
MLARFVVCCAAITWMALLAAPAKAANYMDQISRASAMGMFPASASAGTACMDDFEINGLAGEGSGRIVAIQAVVRGAMPPAFRVNIYHNTHDPLFTNLRMQPVGDAFTQVFPAPLIAAQPFPVPGETGTFPGAILLTFQFESLFLPLGDYYLSVVAENNAEPFFIVGSDTVTEGQGTPLNLVRVTNQGPAGNAQVVANNAAYRVIGVPAPPPNDHCVSPRNMMGDTIMFNNFDATTDGAASCGFGGDAGGADVWFRYTPAVSGEYSIETCGSSFDTILSVVDTCGGAEFVCNDDSCGTQSRVTLPLVAGSPILIRVAGYQGQVGAGTLAIAAVVEDCPSDFNNDGNRDPDDLADFITCFFLQVQFPGFCTAADFNNDDFINPDDLADFITVFFLFFC